MESPLSPPEHERGPSQDTPLLQTMDTGFHAGERKWLERNGSNRPPVPWVESSPFRNWVEWTWVDLEKCQVQGRQHIDFDPNPFDPIRPQSIRPKLFDQKGRPNSFRPISFDPIHAIFFMRPTIFKVHSRTRTLAVRDASGAWCAECQLTRSKSGR